MANFKLIVTSAFFLGISLTGLSQTTKTIDSLETQYENCLDKGEYMLGCSKTFYAQMDSMLNVVYFRLRLTLDSSKQTELKKEQKRWLQKRNNYFNKTLKNFKENNSGKLPYGSAVGALDDAMIMYDDNAEFVKSRVIELLKRLNK